MLRTAELSHLPSDDVLADAGGLPGPARPRVLAGNERVTRAGADSGDRCVEFLPAHLASQEDRLRANLDVFDLQLTPDDLADLDRVATDVRVGGQDPSTHEEF